MFTIKFIKRDVSTRKHKQCQKSKRRFLHITGRVLNTRLNGITKIHYQILGFRDARLGLLSTQGNAHSLSLDLIKQRFWLLNAKMSAVLALANEDDCLRITELQERVNTLDAAVEGENKRTSMGIHPGTGEENIPDELLRMRATKRIQRIEQERNASSEELLHLETAMNERRKVLLKVLEKEKVILNQASLSYLQGASIFFKKDINTGILFNGQNFAEED